MESISELMDGLILDKEGAAGSPLVFDLATITSKHDLAAALPKFRDLSSLSLSDVGCSVWTRARIHTSRLKGKQCFVVLRTKFTTCQALVSVKPPHIPKTCLQVLVKVPPESVVDVCGTVEATPFKVSGCTIQDIELHIEKVLVVSRSDPVLPMQMEDAMRPIAADLAHVNQDTKLDCRIIDLRTPANQAIYAIEAGICKIFREQFEKFGFTEIFTPKIIGAASEGGANVFKVQYFKTDAFLAQSPQLYKQMAIAGDFERV